MVMVFKTNPAIPVKQWFFSIIDLRAEISFIIYYLALEAVPKNKLGFIRRFGVGAVFGVSHVCLLALFCRHDLAYFRNAIASR